MKKLRPDLARWVCYFGGCAILLLLSFGFLQQQAVKGYPAFGTYWASGRASIDGQNPYAVYPATFRSNFTPFHGPPSVPDPNLNPPILLPLFTALGHFPLSTFAWVLTAGSVFLFAIVAGLLVWNLPQMQMRQVLWLLLSTLVVDTVETAEIYAILFALAALAWLFAHRGRPTLAAISIGLLIAIKPTMAFFLPFLWLAGHRRIAWRAAIATGIASIAPLLFYGPRPYMQWVEALHGDLHWLAYADIALIALFRRHGLKSCGIVAAAALAACLAWMLWKRGPSFASACGTAVCAGILCAPLGWHSYLILAAPFFVSRRWDATATVAACILVVPSILTLHWGSGLYLVAAGLLLYSFLNSAPAPERDRNLAHVTEAMAGIRWCPRMFPNWR